MKMLFAYKIVFSTLLCSRYTNAIAIKDAMGKAIIKPAILGYWPASQEEKAIIKPASKVLNIKNI